MNVILVLANNMEWFKLMVANFPASINNFKLIVVNEVRIGDKTEEIERILEHSIIHDYEIISSNIINQKFKEDVIDNSFVDDYTMSMNILSLWYVYKYILSIKKILLLDDDVILREGFDKVFESDKHLFYHTALVDLHHDYYRLSANARSIFNEWFRIFKIDFSLDWWQKEYIKKYANSGQRLIIMKNFDVIRYERCLKEFFKSEIFYRAWTNRNTYCSWYFDERFENFFFFDNLNHDLKKTYNYLLVCRNPQKMNENHFGRISRSTLFHNATNSHKRELYDMLIERGIIHDSYI